MEEKRTQSFGIKISKSMEDELKRISLETTISSPHMGLAALKSIIDYYREHQELRLPFVIVPKKEYERLKKLDT